MNIDNVTVLPNRSRKSPLCPSGAIVHINSIYNTFIDQIQYRHTFPYTCYYIELSSLPSSLITTI